MKKKMESTIMRYIGTTIRIHSFSPSSPKVCPCYNHGTDPRNWALGFRVLSFRMVCGDL